MNKTIDKTVLGIVGSPQKNGSTSRLIRRILDGSQKCGCKTTLINVHELNLSYCTGCNTCETTRECVLDDNFGKLKRLFWTADIIVIGSPSYWGDVTGQLKVMFDRFTPYCDTIDGKTTVPSGKKGIGLAVRAGASTKENNHIINSIQHFFGHLGIPLIESLSVENVKSPDDLSDKLLDSAFKLGTKIESGMKGNRQ